LKKMTFTIFTILLVFSIAGCAHNDNTQISQDKNLHTIKKDAPSNEYSGSNFNPSIYSTNNSQNPDDINEIKSDLANISKKGNTTKTCPSPLSDDITLIDPDPDNKYIENTAASPKKKTNRKKNAQAVMDEAIDYCQMSQELWQNGELENAIEALDHAYSTILSLDIDENDTNLTQQKEDIRFTISKRILEIYASRNFAVSGNHKAIPMVMNSHIQAEINLFTTGREKLFFIESLKRSGRYRAKIVKELEKAGIPVELSWLPLIESGFKVNALSSARALGLWQFIPSTGYKFGLKRDIFVDERLDPIKSTEAAIAYLKELHGMFGDWTTVLAAYNCGEGRVLRLIRDQNVNYLDNFWDLYEKLPRETARYVPRFLATLHILANHDKYGIDVTDIECPIESESIEITKQVHINNIAKEIDVDETLLKRLNPELRYCILPPSKYLFKVPPDKGKELLAKIDAIPTASVSPENYSIAYYKVKRGDTLSIIARRYGTSVKELMRDNRMRKPILLTGTKLKIPYRGASLSTATLAETTQQNGRNDTKQTIIEHVVKSGESLGIIAKRNKTTIKNLQELNNLKSLNICIGQILSVPKSDNYKQNNNLIKKYRVRSGDNLYKIAQKHNMSLDRLLDINKLRAKSTILSGQYLYVE